MRKIVIHNYFPAKKKTRDSEGAELTRPTAIATGRSLTQYLKTSRAVREWCKAEGVNRLMEAFVVQGFINQRLEDGESGAV